MMLPFLPLHVFQLGKALRFSLMTEVTHIMCGAASQVPQRVLTSSFASLFIPPAQVLLCYCPNTPQKEQPTLVILSPLAMLFLRRALFW